MRFGFAETLGAQAVGFEGDVRLNLVRKIAAPAAKHG